MAGGSSSPARSQPSSTEEGPLSPDNFGSKCLEFRFRFREWTQIFPPLLITCQPSFIPNLSTWTVRGNTPELKYCRDDGFFASEVPVLTEISDTQVPVFQEEGRLLLGKTWWNFSEKEKG